MLLHYIKIAFRNLWKYKTQSIISIVGLAVGFTCFALATLWMHYEMTYDSFHKDANRLFVVTKPDAHHDHVLSRDFPRPFAEYLKQTFPEIEEAAYIGPSDHEYWVNDTVADARLLQVDTSFLKLFDIKILEKNTDHLLSDNDHIIVTKEKADEISSNRSVLGEKVMGRYTIAGVVEGWSKHSNYPFDFLVPINDDMRWDMYNNHVLIRLRPCTDLKQFKEKLYRHEVKSPDENTSRWTHTEIISLKEVFYKDVEKEREVKFEHIGLFALAGCLIILCALFNYYTLFISRFRMRQKEFALRLVNGATDFSLLLLLSVEFLLLLTLALFISIFIFQFFYSPFVEMTRVGMSFSKIYPELLLYTLGVTVFSLTLFLILLIAFRKRTLNTSIRQGNKTVLRKASVVFQLVISIVFIFCTSVIFKQIHYLHNTELGFAYKNRVSIQYDKYINKELFINELNQIPEVAQVLPDYFPILPVGIKRSMTIKDWEDKSENAEDVLLCFQSIDKQYFDFYEMQLLEGEMLSESSARNEVLINESAVKAFGWSKAVGKVIDENTFIKGVVKDVYSSIPTIPIQPIMYTYDTKTLGKILPYYLLVFRYEEKSGNIGRKKVNDFIESKMDEFRVSIDLYDMEEEYSKYFVSERSLLKLLGIASGVCVLIAIFGFFSLVSLVTEERRKEIAIRKVNGATIRTILSLFFQEYFLLLIIAALVTFPVAYYLMRPWLSSYTLQTSIDWWIYVVILLALTLVILLSVVFRILKAAKENPSETLKSE
jgi:ABC-type transport system, involved in lipoprotein release, permease component